MARGLVLRVVATALCISALVFAPSAHAGKKTTTTTSGIPCTISVFDTVVDEQNTTLFYNDGDAYCRGIYDAAEQLSAVRGPDSDTSVAYHFDTLTPWSGDPWTPRTFNSSSYENGADCSSSNSCMQASLDSGSKILTLDTRYTQTGRGLHIDLSHPCLPADECPGAGGDATVFGGSITVAGLLNVFLEYPFTSVAVCSSRICPEVRSGYAKFWFTDPHDASVTWRIDWDDVRVLRMNGNTWYLIADNCDGTQTAGLSKLEGKNTRPRTVFNGYYNIPFFITAAAH